MYLEYIVTYCPSLKYSLRVLEKRLEYLTNSLLRCSNACLPTPGVNVDTSFTASNNFLIADAISLEELINCLDLNSCL